MEAALDRSLAITLDAEIADENMTTSSGLVSLSTYFHSGIKSYPSIVPTASAILKLINGTVSSKITLLGSFSSFQIF